MLSLASVRTREYRAGVRHQLVPERVFGVTPTSAENVDAGLRMNADLDGKRLRKHPYA
jgi:hypothetical protein